jgi:hypothetical protein
MVNFRSIVLIRMSSKQNIDVTLKLKNRDKITFYIRNYVYIGTRQKNSDKFMIGEKVVGGWIQNLNLKPYAL